MTDVLKIPEGDRMIDLEELKRKIDEFQATTRSCAVHGDMEAYAEEVEATKDALLETVLAKLEAAQRLREFTATLTRSHYYCEDGWYSCPQAEEGCANESRGPECDCGADEYNAALSKALAAFDKEQQ